MVGEKQKAPRRSAISQYSRGYKEDCSEGAACSIKNVGETNLQRRAVVRVVLSWARFCVGQRGFFSQSLEKVCSAW